MGRPIKESAESFLHSAHGDGIGSILENSFGSDGYAAWYKLQERLAGSKRHVIDVSRIEALESLAAGVRQKPDALVTILDKAASLDGIDRELWQHRMIWCQGLVDGLKPIYGNRRRHLPQKPAVPGRQPGVARPPRENKGSRRMEAACPYEDILNLWKEKVPSLPKPETPIDPSSSRAKAIKVRWQQNPDLGVFREVFAKVEASDFLSGRSGKWTVCSIDWVMDAANWQKVKEGNYENRRVSDGKVRPKPDQGRVRPIVSVPGG